MYQPQDLESPAETLGFNIIDAEDDKPRIEEYRRNAQCEKPELNASYDIGDSVLNLPSTVSDDNPRSPNP